MFWCLLRIVWEQNTLHKIRMSPLRRLQSHEIDVSRTTKEASAASQDTPAALLYGGHQPRRTRQQPYGMEVSSLAWHASKHARCIAADLNIHCGDQVNLVLYGSESILSDWLYPTFESLPLCLFSKSSADVCRGFQLDFCWEENYDLSLRFGHRAR